jgi:benzoylformate decarboxylase
MSNLPTKASEIAQRLHAYDAVFALGGKSLITILYTEGSAVPPGTRIFQLSADAGELGRTYPTKLSMGGDTGVARRAPAPTGPEDRGQGRSLGPASRNRPTGTRGARRVASARRAERAVDIAATIEAGISSGLPNLIEIPISSA